MADQDYMIPLSVARLTLKLQGMETIPDHMIERRLVGRVMEQCIRASNLDKLQKDREDAEVRRGLAVLGRTAAKTATSLQGGVRFVEEK